MPIEGSLTTQAEPSLRDTLTAAVEAKEVATAAPATLATPSQEDVGAQPAATPVTEDRARGPDGKFVAKPKEETPPADVPPVEEIKRPSSWKKDYWGHWDKLTKGEALTREEAVALAKYAAEREGDFVKGVSTYKQEWDRARPILEALHPYRELIQKANATPEQFIQFLGNTHQVLTHGTPQEKLREITRLANAYQVPVNELVVQGEDGKFYLNQSYLNQQAQPQSLTPADVEKIVAQRLAQTQLNQSIKNFIEAKDDSGNPKHPHYQAVWKTMDGILRAGLAQDLPTAYKVALNLPQHSDLAPPAAPQPKVDSEADKLKAAAEAAAKAKRNTVSPKNEAPTSLVTTQPKSAGLRASIESAVEAHLGGGRV